MTNGDEQSENRIWDQTGVPSQVGVRATNVESVYDYGSRVGVWRILNLLEEHQIKATAYAVGQAFEMNPEVARAFTQNGHEVASHCYR